MSIIVIDKVRGVHVLRDDLLPGGTKSVLMETIIGDDEEYVYASPVYGGFQIALASYCRKVGKKATIFCAKRKLQHPNTKEVERFGGKVVEVPHGYLNVVQKRASDYCQETGAINIKFGAQTKENIDIIANRAGLVFSKLGRQPSEIFCAIGSGTLVTAILQASTSSQVIGIQVGQECTIEHPRLTIIKHHLSFDKPSKEKQLLKSTVNYDLKAWEYCLKYKRTNDVLFWNVL